MQVSLWRKSAVVGVVTVRPLLGANRTSGRASPFRSRVLADLGPTTDVGSEAAYRRILTHFGPNVGGTVLNLWSTRIAPCYLCCGNPRPIWVGGESAPLTQETDRANPNPPPVDRLSELWRRLNDHKIAQWSVAYIAVAYALQHGVVLTRDRKSTRLNSSH